MKNNAVWKVYKYTNKKNGMSYIGNTCQTLKDRAGKEGRGYKRKDGGKFYKAIQEFGWDSFEVEILNDNILEKSESYRIESERIKEFDSLNNGYNETDNNAPINKNKTWKWNISEDRKEEIKLRKSKRVICGGVLYNSVEELSDKIGISKGTLYGWMAKDIEYVNYSKQRDYYLNKLGLKYYDDITKEEENKHKLIYENKILSNDIQIQELRLSINKSLISIFNQLEELVEFELDKNTITSGETSNYFYLKNVINKILKL